MASRERPVERPNAPEAMERPGQWRPTLAPSVRLQADPVTRKPVVLFREGLLQLNSTAEAVLRLCDGQTTVEQIIGALRAEYGTVAALEHDVTKSIRDFVKYHVLVLAK